MWRTSKTFRFSAAHALSQLEDGRQCGRLHGHDYTVEVIMQSNTLSSEGFVRDPIDYRRIEKFLRRLDRQDLNEVFAAEFEDDLRGSSIVAGQPRSDATHAALDEALYTTNENIARALFLRFRAEFPEITAVRVGHGDLWAEFAQL